mmetsp:Transcript_65752/g.158542  ORF Transcript_65752/g.158542 Transcript_65752/m.158542 type:complete len:513 (+) Transcript_65752:146-1684(+)
MPRELALQKRALASQWRGQLAVSLEPRRRHAAAVLVGRGLPAAVAQHGIRAVHGVCDESLDGVQLAAVRLTVRVRRGGRRLRVARGVGAGDDGAAPTLGVEGDGGVEGEGGQAEEGAHALHGGGCRAEEVVGELEQQVLAVREPARQEEVVPALPDHGRHVALRGVGSRRGWRLAGGGGGGLRGAAGRGRGEEAAARLARLVQRGVGAAARGGLERRDELTKAAVAPHPLGRVGAALEHEVALVLVLGEGALRGVAQHDDELRVRHELAAEEELGRGGVEVGGRGLAGEREVARVDGGEEVEVGREDAPASDGRGCRRGGHGVTHRGGAAHRLLLEHRALLRLARRLGHPTQGSALAPAAHRRLRRRLRRLLLRLRLVVAAPRHAGLGELRGHRGHDRACGAVEAGLVGLQDGGPHVQLLALRLHHLWVLQQPVEERGGAALGRAQHGEVRQAARVPVGGARLAPLVLGEDAAAPVAPHGAGAGRLDAVVRDDALRRHARLALCAEDLARAV